MGGRDVVCAQVLRLQRGFMQLRQQQLGAKFGPEKQQAAMNQMAQEMAREMKRYEAQLRRQEEVHAAELARTKQEHESAMKRSEQAMRSRLRRELREEIEDRVRFEAAAEAEQLQGQLAAKDAYIKAVEQQVNMYKQRGRAAEHTR